VTALEIISYPHPTLRHKSKSLKLVDKELRSIVSEMFELMYEARGIGLAANQVDLPLRLFVINTTADPSQKDEERVFINPVLDSPKGKSEAEEGCLSIPGVFGNVPRPSQIRVSGFDLAGNSIDYVAEGLLGRAIQHEYDHLDGVLFIDRLSESAHRQIESDLEAFVLDFDHQLVTGKVLDDKKIAERLIEFESKYC
jgi:peptide deformylase